MTEWDEPVDWNEREGFTLSRQVGGYTVGIGEDLEEASLAWMDLCGASLSAAKLRRADLRGAELRGADLRGTKLSEANLSEADLSEANLRGADLQKANLHRANLTRANLNRADLRGADLTGANLNDVELYRTNLSGADLRGARLDRAHLVDCRLDGADLTGARVYGASVWDARGVPEAQNDLVITPQGSAEVTVDNLNVAQFIYLLLSNDDLRGVIDTITSKAVLILGRFTPERKPTLDAVRRDLRKRYNYSPIVFDFDKPSNKTIADTVKLLANMSRFVIVDLTEATSANFEVGMITSLGLRRLPIAFMIERGHSAMSMLSSDVLGYPEVVDRVHEYDDLTQLSETLVDAVLEPAERLWHELNPDA